MEIDSIIYDCFYDILLFIAILKLIIFFDHTMATLLSLSAHIIST